jgi:uncharacterized peroxidase-related enzyme
MPDNTCWIDTIDYDEAGPELRSVFDQVLGPDGQLDNLYRAFSLRGHTILPADDLYKAVLHHGDNTLSKRFSELLGCYVAILTGCDYALAHHGHNFVHLSSDSDHAQGILSALRLDRTVACGDAREVAALDYTRKLCRFPEDVSESDVEALRDAGWVDGEVLEIVQVVAMFSYFTRVINGVGIALGNEKLGLY